jgi:hypothetical protein
MMARVDCPHEADVLTMVFTGQWPGRAPADLVAHAATCAVCADVATVASAIDSEQSDQSVPPLPSSGIVWWRAQLRARQEAARAVVRPITFAQGLLLAAMGGMAGAVFGATTGWFQRALASAWGLVADLGSRVSLPSAPTLADGAYSVLAGYTVTLTVVGVALIVGTAIVVWAFREG